MRFTIAIAIAAIAAIKSTKAQQEAQVQLYNSANCASGLNEINVPSDYCISADAMSAQQDKGEDGEFQIIDNRSTVMKLYADISPPLGIKFTCNGYSDSACKNKVGEVYDCLNSQISYISCYENDDPLKA